MAERCPVCRSDVTNVFVRRYNMPAHQNLVMRTAAEATAITRGELAMATCSACGFMFNAAFDAARLNYGESYDNNQSCSPMFRNYLNGLVHRLTIEENVLNCCVVEVGCGKGDFLRRLIEAPGSANIGIGFDPAYVGPETDSDGRLRFVRSFYGAEAASVPADVVVCRHVIEHVPLPIELLRSVREALANSPDARVYFETPDAAWILRNRVLWDLFYEHCSLFTRESLTTAFEIAGFQVTRVDSVFGGQYLWLEARAAAGPVNVSRDPADTEQLAQEYSVHEEALRRDWNRTLEALRQRGRVALWGAGAKGVTFANLIDPRRERIDCVVDVNPNKQGRFLPGTGHPIVDYHELPGRQVASAILMNPNYLEESRGLLRAAGIEIELIGHS